MAYAERTIAPGIEVWRTTGPAGPHRILPDGCIDLILMGERLVVAGPDTAARVHGGDTAPETVTGVRLHAGRGPLLLGVPADALRDRTVPLEDLWGSARARALTEQVGERPATALADWATSSDGDAFGALVHRLLDRGSTVDAVADAVGYSPRTLHRRLLPLIGYGPQQLGRVLRLVRAVADADTGRPWSEVAQRAGYVDQPHLAREVRALAGVTPTVLLAERVRSVQDAA